MFDDDVHPLLAELTSLRQTAARFQHEAHAAAIMLQRYSADSSRLHEHAATLEQENARLAHELDVLRAHPDVPHHPAVEHAQELSLALRRVSDKITLTEASLLQRTSELTDARSELARARHATDGAYALAARMRAREEACKAREHELEFKARASEEERKMVDLVVQEYADLVRTLEGRKSANHTPSNQNGSVSTITLVDNLQDGKSTLHKMLTAFSAESDQFHATIAELNAKVSDLQMTLDAERIAASHDRTLLAQTRTELDRLNLEDQTAAKMVARYMKFSQASTNALQQQITTLKTRHASTINTVELQLSIVESQLASERAHSARLQDALDELGEDLARESYGRRREVALRLALLAREEGIAEFMRRWARRARESYARCYNSAAPHVSPGDAVQEAFHRVVSDAESLLSTLDDDMQISDAMRASGSLARIALSREAVEALRSELQDEMQKRMEVVRKSASSLLDGRLNGTAPEIEELPQPEGIPPQGGGGASDLLPTLNSNPRPEHEVALVELPRSQDATSPDSVIGALEELIYNPPVVAAPVAPSVTEPAEQTSVQGEIHSLPSSSVQDSTSTLATLLVDEEPKALQPHPPAVSVLDLEQDLQPRTEAPSTTDEVPIHTLPDDPSPPQEVNHAEVLTEDDIPLPSISISSSIPTVCYAVLDPPTNSPPTLLSALGATKHRYDALQHAFRDCSLALKELKRTLASPSPSPHVQTKLRQHLEIALARIEDYAEDARVELEIRVADEELTARGYETVLSVPGALVDADERAEVEASARGFVDGTDEGVAKALDKFGRKLENVQHDVAAVKRTVHELAMSDGENGEDGVVDGDGGDVVAGKDAESGAGSAWTVWAAGLLGGNPAPARSPTPAQTFGAVMTSPRLRHAASLKQLHAQASADEGNDHGPLAALNLRVPMPSPSHVPLSYGHLGLGRATEGPTRPKTLSTMYTLGGLRSSSVGLGVGLGGSPSSARTRMQGVGGRPESGLGWGGVSSALRAGRGDSADAARVGEYDFGDVE